MFRKVGTLFLAATALMLWTNEAQSQAVITNGVVTLGVNAAGHLNFGGFGLSVGGFESTLDGCPCEGWGAGVVGGTYDGLSAGWNQTYGGLVNGGGVGSVVSFASDGVMATSVTRISTVGGDDVLEITHEYKPSASPDLYEVNVTIKNLTGETIGNGVDGIRYRRLMDWDIQPTSFSEYVTINGNGASALLGTSDDGFDLPLPGGLGGTRRSVCGGSPVDADFVDNGPCDHGALFDFGFGDLAAGESRMFTTFYGGSTSEAGMFAALAAVGAEDVYSFGQCNSAGDARCDEVVGSPITFAFAFKGVGGGTVGDPPTSVPEPGTMLLIATGLLGIAARRRTSLEVEDDV
ncbi:MAG: PEP-CTERM sorting domain-containing protein [Gemmatimonadota bacterium]|nr:PEP-CTERM sorting domain-containing protein [Gemmatimonadota bacterium]